MTMERDQARTILQDALAALKRGEREAAQQLAEQAATLAPDWETPWLILTALASPEDSLAFIDKALKINPVSHTAQQALVWALERRHAQPAQVESQPLKKPEALAREPVPAPARERVRRPHKRAKPLTVRASAQSDTEPTRDRIARALDFVPEQPDGQPVPFPIPLPVSALPAEPVIKVMQVRDGEADRPPVVKVPVKTTPSFIRTYLYAPIVLIVLALIGGLIFMRPQLASAWALLFKPASVAQCVPPTLEVGETQWPLASIARSTDGSLAVPLQTDRVYWVEGTDANPVFEVNPDSPAAAAFADIQSGDSLTVTWTDCTSQEYVVSTVVSGSPITASFFDQSRTGMALIVPASSSKADLVIQGMTPEALIPVSGGSSAEPGVKAVVSLVNQTASADGKTLTLIVTVRNTGANPLDLTGDGISLTAGNSASLAPLSVLPALPQSISPDASQNFIFTFPRPPGESALFRILGLNLDIRY
jgi:hypothetical protein